MQTAKYYILQRSLSKIRTSETDKWTFFCIVNTFQEVKDLVEQLQDVAELRVIKGRELEFVEEVEEKFVKQRIVKSRKLKDS